jgi:acetoin:2,6-dichlorophenolindophenol oxidoreductase subunit alpha
MNRETPSDEVLVGMLERMILIRRVEERLGQDSRAGRLAGNVHLYIGQEAIAAGVCARLRDDDYIGSTHRGHGHFLAKGGTPESLVAEIYGRDTGACHGFGGSMHVADLSRGMLGANGIVGGGIGIAAGAALTAQMARRGQVAVAFFGDGAASQGVLTEVLNIGALWKLPLILMCEHNCYSEFSPTDTVTAGELADRAKPYGVPAIVVDGNDAVAVWEAAGAAVARARAGDGPTFIEAKSYRLHGHLEAEAGFVQEKYRSDEEIAAWRARDPIPRLAAELERRGCLGADGVRAIEAKVAAIVAAAVEAAEAAPLALQARLQEMISAAAQHDVAEVK